MQSQVNQVHPERGKAVFGFGCKDACVTGWDSRTALWENTAVEGKLGGQGAGGEQVCGARRSAPAGGEIEKSVSERKNTQPQEERGGRRGPGGMKAVHNGV